jgi:hypothetical protein
MVTLMENEDPKIVCGLTSYPKRIKNCYRVIKSLLENTVVPDRIYLTLARPQFKNDLDDLPPLIRKLVIENPRVFINWVDIDTKAFKQVMPVLQYLEDEDIIICCDDDILYPSDYIEARLTDMKEFDAPLTGCITQTGRTLYEKWGIPSSTGYVCCFKKKHIRHIETFVDQKVLHTFNADGTYAMVEWLNGYVAHDVTKYDRDWMHEHCSWNEVYPGRENGVYMFGNDMLDVFRNRVCELTGKDIFDSKSALFSKGFFAQ